PPFGHDEVFHAQDDPVRSRWKLRGEFKAVDRVAEPGVEAVPEPGALPAVGRDQQAFEFNRRMGHRHLRQDVSALADPEPVSRTEDLIATEPAPQFHAVEIILPGRWPRGEHFGDVTRWNFVKRGQ